MCSGHKPSRVTGEKYDIAQEAVTTFNEVQEMTKNNQISRQYNSVV